MNAKEFFNTVEQMRAAQNAYFAARRRFSPEGTGKENAQAQT